MLSENEKRKLYNCIKDTSTNGQSFAQGGTLYVVPCHCTTRNKVSYFLYHEENTDGRYSAINTARSVLSAVLSCRNCQSFGKDQIVTDFIQGVFNPRQPIPRYVDIWDPDQVQNLFKERGIGSSFSLYKLSQKTACLILLATGVRGHIIGNLNR